MWWRHQRMTSSNLYLNIHMTSCIITWSTWCLLTDLYIAGVITWQIIHHRTWNVPWSKHQHFLQAGLGFQAGQVTRSKIGREECQWRLDSWDRYYDWWKDDRKKDDFREEGWFGEEKLQGGILRREDWRKKHWREEERLKERWLEERGERWWKKEGWLENAHLCPVLSSLM